MGLSRNAFCSVLGRIAELAGDAAVRTAAIAPSLASASAAAAAAG